jgi:exodeoxyribonuclease VII small subunit
MGCSAGAKALTLAASFGTTKSRALTQARNGFCDCLRRPGNSASGGHDLNYNRVGSLTLPKFEECLERLEKIVAELEKGEVSLDRALELFDEGMKLSGSCRKELEEAEGKVEVLLKRNGKLQPEAFESATQSGDERG